MPTVTLLRFILDIIILATLIVIDQFLYVLPPFQSGFYCNDYSINLNDKPDTVAISNLYYMIFLVSLPLILVTKIVTSFKVKSNRIRLKPIAIKQSYKFLSGCNSHCYVPEVFGDIYSIIGIYLLGAVVTDLFTNIGKITIGRLRPNFLDVCQPYINPYKEVCDGEKYTYVVPGKDFLCRSSKKEYTESMRSFPSGHASMSFYPMVFLTLFINRTWKNQHMGIFKHLIQFIFLSVALFTALSRVQDNKHHATDVLAGSILGTFLALMAYLKIYGISRENSADVRYASVADKDFDLEKGVKVAQAES